MCQGFRVSNTHELTSCELKSYLSFNEIPNTKWFSTNLINAALSMIAKSQADMSISYIDFDLFSKTYDPEFTGDRFKRHMYVKRYGLCQGGTLTNIFNYGRIIAVPNISNHWMTIVIDINTRTIHYVDSMNYDDNRKQILKDVHQFISVSRFNFNF